MLVPMLEMSAVTQVPMLRPITTGIAMPYVIMPVRDSACNMPMLAALLWIMPVNIMPTSTPSTGLLKEVSMLANSGMSFSGATASPIMVMPNISIAKPTITPPISRRFCVLHTIIIITPIRAITGEKFSGLSMLKSTLLLFMPARESIQAVSVVPMLLPIIMPVVCSRLSMPLLTRPTSMTVTAEED